jgi:hypothetical protein
MDAESLTSCTVKEPKVLNGEYQERHLDSDQDEAEDPQHRILVRESEK